MLYDGQYLANTSGVVVVTVNYRLGAMGFLVYKSDEEGAPTGNYGLRVCCGIFAVGCIYTVIKGLSE